MSAGGLNTILLTRHARQAGEQPPVDALLVSLIIVKRKDIVKAVGLLQHLGHSPRIVDRVAQRALSIIVDADDQRFDVGSAKRADGRDLSGG